MKKKNLKKKKAYAANALSWEYEWCELFYRQIQCLCIGWARLYIELLTYAKRKYFLYGKAITSKNKMKNYRSRIIDVHKYTFNWSKTRQSLVLLFTFSFQREKYTCTSICIEQFHHYTPVFRRDVLWYGDVRPSGSPSDSPSVRPTLRPSVRVSVRPFSTLFSYMLWHIELKFCTSLCFNVLQIKFECRHFASIFEGVMPLLELRI